MKGAAAGVRNMDVMLAEVTPAIEKALTDVQLEADMAAEFRKFLESGKRIRCWFLEHVHKQAQPGATPDLLNLKRAMDGWAKAALTLAAI
ncbi:MAG: hypothetical protein M3404_00480 [Actinomycetota bacterium]|nr:hypothetical protein [Actinomycetota bacterium]